MENYSLLIIDPMIINISDHLIINRSISYLITGFLGHRVDWRTYILNVIIYGRLIICSIIVDDVNLFVNRQ